MSTRAILASVGTVQLFDPSTGDLIVTSKTLTESSLSFSVDPNEVQGGEGNKLLGRFFTNSQMKLTLTDALYSMEYTALNCGSTIEMGGDVLAVEQFTVAEANKIQVSETPRPFGTIGTIGWYSVAGKDTWSKIVFDPSTKTASVAGVPVGTTVCVKYFRYDAAAETMTVSSAFIPSQCYALLTLPLYKASSNEGSYTSSSKIGEVQVEIPTFVLDGAQELSLTSSGASTSSLSGSALATYTGLEGCEGDGYYGKLKQVIFNKDEFAGVKSIVIADSDIDLTIGEKQKLQVYAIYGGIVAPRLIDNSKITFTSDKTNIAAVVNGEVDAKASGTAIIEAVVTGKSDLVAKAVATVTA